MYARLAGYEDTNDHEGLSRDPAMRAVIGKRALKRTAADCLTTTGTKWFGGDMESSIGELATDSSQPYWHGRNRGKVTALEAVYEECRIIFLLSLHDIDVALSPGTGGP